MLHQVMMHDGNLTGRAAEADKAQFEPIGKGLPERDGCRGV